MLGKKKELEIPVYLFMGFLEAGKTTFIQETLEEDRTVRYRKRSALSQQLLSGAAVLGSGIFRLPCL